VQYWWTSHPPFWLGERVGLPVTSQAVHRLYGTKPAIISTRLRAELSPVLSHFEHGIAIMPKNWAGNGS